MNPRTGLLVSLAIIVAACEVVPSNLPALPPTPVSGIPAPPPPPGSDDIASKTYPQPLSVPLAEEILLKTGVFNFHNSPGASHQAYLLLIDLPDGVGRLQSIARSGGRAGQLYALCALWERAPVLAAELSAQLETVTEEVVVLDNDVRSKRPVSEVVDLIRRAQLWLWFRNQKDMGHG